jgi:hypothetical protein
MVSVRVPIIAVSVWIVVPISIIGRIPDTTWIVVISIWPIGLPLIVVVGKDITPPAPHAAGIIIGGVSTAKNPTGRKPDLLVLMIRLCKANWCYQQQSWQ